MSSLTSVSSSTITSIAALPAPEIVISPLYAYVAWSPSRVADVLKVTRPENAVLMSEPDTASVYEPVSSSIVCVREKPLSVSLDTPSETVSDVEAIEIESIGAADEGILVHTFDLDAIASYRADWGFFRDRRPELYAN